MIDVEQGEDGVDQMICKVADFGFSTMLERGEGSRVKLGTPHYMAPEILNGQVYNNKVDIWALGVLTYVLLNNGNFPFE